MPKLTARTLRASAASVASSVSAAVDISPDTTLDLTAAVSAIAGTLTVTVETSRDNVTWTTLTPTTEEDVEDDLEDGPFAAFSAVSSQFRVFPDCQRYVRVRWVHSGGGTATFSVLGESVRVYARVSDMPDLGIRSPWLEGVSAKKQDRAIRKLTDITDSAVGMYNAVPLTTWGDDIRGGVCACSVVELFATVGSRPDEQDEKLVIDRCAAYDKWLALVAKGDRKPAGTIDATPSTDDGGEAYFVTDARRGW